MLDHNAVVVATLDHWQAGMVIDAVRRTKRVVQVGTQRRSAELFLEAQKIMESGQPGDIRLVTSY